MNGSLSGRHPAKHITANCLVQEVVERHPQVIRVFVRHGLQCVGCHISPFHTIADTAREYSLQLEALLADLNRAIAAVSTETA